MICDPERWRQLFKRDDAREHRPRPVRSNALLGRSPVFLAEATAGHGAGPRARVVSPPYMHGPGAARRPARGTP